MNITRRTAIGALSFAPVVLSSGLKAKESSGIRVGGTGSANGMMNRLSAAWSKASGEPVFKYLSGLGSGGAIQATRDKVLDFAVSARRLSEGEKRDLVEAPFLQSPFVFASSRVNAGSHTIGSIASLYQQPAARWPDETPVRIVLRPRNESDSKLLEAQVPEVAKAIELARMRPDVPVAATDQDNGELGQRLSGSLLAISLMQIISENLRLNPLAIDNIEPSLQSMADGRYPFNRHLYLIYNAAPSEAVQSFFKFLRTPDVEISIASLQSRLLLN